MATMEHPIRNRMSDKGRVVVPAPIREALGIGVGDALDWRVEDSEAQGLPSRGGVLRKRGARTRADGQEPDTRHTAPDELARDSEVHIHQGCWLQIRRLRVEGLNDAKAK